MRCLTSCHEAEFIMSVLYLLQVFLRQYRSNTLSISAFPVTFGGNKWKFENFLCNFIQFQLRLCQSYLNSIRFMHFSWILFEFFSSAYFFSALAKFIHWIRWISFTFQSEIALVVTHKTVNINPNYIPFIIIMLKCLDLIVDVLVK